jgi:hypothetical protein
VLAGLLILRPGAGGPPAQPGRSTAPPQQGAGAPGGNPPAIPTDTRSSPPASPTLLQAANPELPAGWSRASGPGYTIGVPAGWRRSVEGRSVFWRDPNSPAYLQVDRTEWTGAPYAAWEQWESEVLTNGSLRNYRRIDLRNVADTPYAAADIEFTWNGQGGRLMHGVDRRVIANGRRYAIFVAIPAGQWSASQERVNGFLTTFRP